MLRLYILKPQPFNQAHFFRLFEVVALFIGDHITMMMALTHCSMESIKVDNDIVVVQAKGIVHF